jgi:hypothetical protein
VVDESFAERVRSVDWANYETAYGPADAVPDLLVQIAYGIDRDAEGAAHQLWSSLCHQMAWVSSAALPALPFIMEVLPEASPQLTTELLDILQGIAVCTEEERLASDPAEWKRSLRVSLASQIEIIRSYIGDPDEDIDAIASNTIDSLER